MMFLVTRNFFAHKAKTWGEGGGKMDENVIFKPYHTALDGAKCWTILEENLFKDVKDFRLRQKL